MAWTKTRLPPSYASFDPERLKQLGELFDEIWASLADDAGPKATDEMREELAKVMLKLAADGQLSDLQIASTAARQMREKFGLS